jgi:hypothetical protein
MPGINRAHAHLVINRNHVYFVLAQNGVHVNHVIFSVHACIQKSTHQSEAYTYILHMSMCVVSYIPKYICTYYYIYVNIIYVYMYTHIHRHRTKTHISQMNLLTDA